MILGKANQSTVPSFVSVRLIDRDPGGGSEDNLQLGHHKTKPSRDVSQEVRENMQNANSDSPRPYDSICKNAVSWYNQFSHLISMGIKVLDKPTSPLSNKFSGHRIAMLILQRRPFSLLTAMVRCVLIMHFELWKWLACGNKF